MKFRIFSIFAGIGQTVGMFVLFYLIQLVLRTVLPDQVMSFELLGVSSLVWVVACIVIGLAYPIHLFRRKQKADGLVVIASTIMSILIFLGFLFFMVEQMFSGID